MTTSFDREKLYIRSLWELHKSPRDHVDGLIGLPADYSYVDKMLQEGTLRQDFRFRGFPNQSMQSPRQPITAPLSEDKKKNEEQFVKFFGKSSVFDPAHHENWKRAPAKPTGYDGPSRLQYGSEQIDNSPRARGMKDPFHHDKTSADIRKLRQQQSEAQMDISKFRQEKMMADFHREEERRQPDNDNRRRKWVEDNPREPMTYANESQKVPKGHDLFIDTLGGPGGTMVRQNGGPGLQSMPDPRMTGYNKPPVRAEDHAQHERQIRDQRNKIEDLKKELEFLRSPRGGYEPSFGSKESTPMRAPARFDEEPRREEKRSLDLEATRGGAGAPLKDDRGRAITRFPVTMQKDDFGTAKIQERIPGKLYNLADDPIYDPFGRPGGGAPMNDRYGNRNTHTYGNFEKLGDGSDVTKRVRAKEVMLNDLRYGMEEQQRNKEEMKRHDNAPYGDLADVMRSKEVGQPKRDPITGSLANQHLPNSDVSKLKMNYQPVEEGEKRDLHLFLKEQVEEGERNKHLEKLRSQQESNKHFDQFDQRWGHFGGGAPKDKRIRKKVNLDNALYHYERETRIEPAPRHRDPPHFTGLVAPNKKRHFEDDIRHQSPDVTPRFVKNTMYSTSNNQYEYPNERSPRPVQRGFAPYATGSAQDY